MPEREPVEERCKSLDGCALASIYFYSRERHDHKPGSIELYPALFIPIPGAAKIVTKTDFDIPYPFSLEDPSAFIAFDGLSRHKDLSIPCNRVYTVIHASVFFRRMTTSGKPPYAAPPGSLRNLQKFPLRAG